MKKLHLVLFTTILMAGLAVGCGRATPAQQTPTPAPTQTQAPVAAQNYSYQGEQGKTALELLKAKYKVETKEFTGVGEYVTSINGVVADSKHFWSFYVNGQPAQVGAGQYQSKSTDQIEWKLEEITATK